MIFFYPSPVKDNKNIINPLREPASDKHPLIVALTYHHDPFEGLKHLYRQNPEKTPIFRHKDSSEPTDSANGLPNPISHRNRD